MTAVVLHSMTIAMLRVAIHSECNYVVLGHCRAKSELMTC